MFVSVLVCVICGCFRVMFGVKYVCFLRVFISCVCVLSFVYVDACVLCLFTCFVFFIYIYTYGSCRFVCFFVVCV